MAVEYGTPQFFVTFTGEMAQVQPYCLQPCTTTTTTLGCSMLPLSYAPVLALPPVLASPRNMLHSK